MIRNILVILIMTMSTSLIAQDHNTYEDFYKSRWEVLNNWSNKDTITLKLAKKKNLKEFELKDYGEFISFNENKKIMYQHFIPCPVGETFRNIENFLIFKNKVDIHYKTKSWDAEETEWKKKHHKYRILHYDDTTMVLVKI